MLPSLYPHTPIQISSFQALLRNHPDQVLVYDVCYSLRHGVDIGYRGPRLSLSTPNMRSALNNPGVIYDTIGKEISSSWSAGPFSTVPFPSCFVVSSIGVVPKKSGKFRMITDLSRPADGVNHGIDKEDFSLQYAGVDQAIAILKRIGPDARMCKLDIKDAFRLIPVRKEDWPLLGYQWAGEYFFHTRLPFGLRSSPFHFNRVASLLAWIVGSVTHSTAIVQYLDDFWCGDTAVNCRKVFVAFQDICNKVGIPLADEKLEGPATMITFLGIQFDAASQTLALPEGKFEEIQQELSEWDGRKKCTKRELLSLIGKLSFAAKCVPAGRIFFRRLIDLSTRVSKLGHHLDITVDAREDLAWWIRFLPLWNGHAKFIDPVWSSTDSFDLYTDAAASVGAGGFFRGMWFFIPWPQAIKEDDTRHITWMELFPIVVAARLWGSEWTERRIMFHTDNMAVVDVWYKQGCRSPQVMSLVRHLHFVAARCNFHVSMRHIPGKSNVYADLISRNLQVEFRRRAPHADRSPTTVPRVILQDLLPNI